MAFGPHLLLAALEGLVTSAVLALTALGLSLVFGVMRVVNLAHGDFLMLGAFVAFGVASPFLPALLHERGLGPSQISAVLAAGTAIRLIIGPAISRLADRLGKHQQTLALSIAMNSS